MSASYDSRVRPFLVGDSWCGRSAARVPFGGSDDLEAEGGVNPCDDEAGKWEGVYLAVVASCFAFAGSGKTARTWWSLTVVA